MLNSMLQKDAHGMKRHVVLFLTILIGSVLIGACASGALPTAPPTEPPPPTATIVPPAPTDNPEVLASNQTPGDAAKAVDLIAAWVKASAPETDSFEYTGSDGGTYQATFEVDVLPLFTQNNVWYEGSQACTGCHFANSANSYHEMDLSSYAGIMAGADVVSAPPGTPILGQSAIGESDFNWDNSRMRTRLRNNRMPPGITFDITESNRNGPLVLHGAPVEVKETNPTFGSGECGVKAVNLIADWVKGGAPEKDPFDFTAEDGSACNGTFEADILPLFTQNSAWYEGSQACTGCHFANSANSYHEMDLSSYAGIMAGADVVSAPPGTPILGQSAIGDTTFDWDHSRMRTRLRDNRMPPGWAFDVTEANRDGQCLDISADGITILPGEFDCEF